MKYLFLTIALLSNFLSSAASAQIEEAHLERRLPDGTIIKRITLYVQPPYYKGDMPLLYRSRVVATSSSGGFGFWDKVIWHEFDGWRNEFVHSTGPFIERAEAWTPEPRTLLATAEREGVDQERGFIYFREKHYSKSGSVIFECVSTYHNQFKIKESDQRGRKAKEFFFLLPLLV